MQLENAFARLGLKGATQIGLMAVVLYLFLFSMGLSDVDLIHPSTQLDITFLREALEVPGGSLVAPLFDIKIPLYFFYLFAPLVLLVLHWFLLRSIATDDLFSGEMLKRLWILVVFALPTLTIALIGWRFLPYGTMLPESEHLKGIQVFYWLLNATVLVLDLALVAAMRMPLQLVAARVQFGSLVLLAAVSFGFVGWRLVQGHLSERLMDWPSIAALAVTGSIALGWTWHVTARWYSAGERRSRLRQGNLLIRGWPAMLMTSLLAFTGAIAITVASQPGRPLVLSGTTLVRVQPSEMAIATIAAGAYSSTAAVSESSTAAMRKIGQVIAQAKPAAITGFGEGFNLTGYRLKRANFTGGQFDLIRLDNALLQGADFTRASLVGASFEGSELRDARFVQADLTGAKFHPRLAVKVAQAQARSEADAHQSSIQDYNDALDFCRTLLNEKNATPNDKNATPKDLRGTSIDLSEAILRNADLQGADLRCANLEKAEIYEETDLNGADFRFANLRHVTVHSASRDPVESSTDSTRPRTKTTQTTDSSETSKVGLRSAKLQGADLSFAGLSEIDLTDSDFLLANLSQTILGGATLAGVNFCGSNLRGVDFTKADFGKECPNFRHADLQGATFCLHQLRDCDLSEASWRGVTILRCPGFEQVKELGKLWIPRTKQDSSNWESITPEQCFSRAVATGNG